MLASYLARQFMVQQRLKVLRIFPQCLRSGGGEIYDGTTRALKGRDGDVPECRFDFSLGCAVPVRYDSRVSVKSANMHAWRLAKTPASFSHVTRTNIFGNNAVRLDTKESAAAGGFSDPATTERRGHQSLYAMKRMRYRRTTAHI
jgi:hypothetical protein